MTTCILANTQNQKFDPANPHIFHPQISTVNSREDSTFRVTLSEFESVMKRIIICLSTENCAEKFKNSVAITTRQISLFLCRECEEFGMTKEIYDALMSYKKAKKAKYENLLISGNFYFEGRNNYNTKMIVLTVGNGSIILSSQIPQEWLRDDSVVVDREVEDHSAIVEVDLAIGGKRKIAPSRDPGNKDFKSAKPANALSKLLSDTMIEIMNNKLNDYSVIKKKKVVEGIILNIKKQYNLHDRNSANYNEINNQIVKSLIEYLNGLKNHGGKYELVESTIEILLAAVSVESSNSTEVGKTLEISRKRISAAKERRMLFDSAIDEKNGRISNRKR